MVIQATTSNYSLPVPLPVQQPSVHSVSYCIKIIPKRKADFMIKKLRGITKVFNSVCEIKKEVCDACDCEISSESFGYVEPGHGYKVVLGCRPFPFFGAGERSHRAICSENHPEARENHTMNFINEHVSSNFYSSQLFSNTPYKQPKPFDGNKSCWTRVH